VGEGGGRICGEASSVAIVFGGEDSCWVDVGCSEASRQADSRGLVVVAVVLAGRRGVAGRWWWEWVQQ
jgi:hypothetical protein